MMQIQKRYSGRTQRRIAFINQVVEVHTGAALPQATTPS